MSENKCNDISNLVTEGMVNKTEENIELDESVTNVTIELPSWVLKRIKTLAALQKISTRSWINRTICKGLKADLKPDKIKWADIYEAVSDEDFSKEELTELLRELFKRTVLCGVERSNHSFSSSKDVLTKETKNG